MKKSPRPSHTITHEAIFSARPSSLECFLTDKLRLLLTSKLTDHLGAREDCVRFYPLCANCVSKVETVGGTPPANDDLFVI
jgi:CRISPR/Cas system-associated endoribonuclease Cas2